MVETVKKFLRESNTESRKGHTIPHNGYFYASEALKCPRSIYYSRVDPKDPDDTLLGVFKIGEILHEFFQDVMMKAQPDLKDEVEVRVKDEEAGIEVSGRADLMGDTEIIEFKTTANVKYNEAEASITHKGQTILYLSQNRDKKAYVIYIDKRNMITAKHEVEFDEIMFDAIMNNFKKAKVALDGGDMPDKPGFVEAWQCKYCSYAKRCKEELLQMVKEKDKKLEEF